MRSEQSHRPTRSQQPRSIGSEQPGQMTAGEPQLENRSGLEDPKQLTRSEMTSSRTTGTAHGNSWLLSCTWQEPAYPMCHIGLASGRCAPPSNPRHPARIGNNLNQIARWANTHAEKADAFEVIAHLLAIERDAAGQPGAAIAPASRPRTCGPAWRSRLTRAS